MENKPEEASSDVNALEEPSAPEPAPADKKPEKSKKKRAGLKNFASRINIYLLLFILIVVLAGFVVFIGLQRNKRELADPTVATTPLTQETLDQLKGSDARVGDAKQTLTVESNAIFSSAVLIKGNLDVAGTIKVGGALSLPGISVSGSSTFDQITANTLSVSGDASVQGTLNVQSNLTVAGGAQFGGPVSAPQLTVQSLTLLSDLGISRHIDAGGGTPGRSNGNALGSGGTASVSGTDTAGTATINTGGGPGAGCFLTVHFAQSFNSVPHIVITPVGSVAAGLNYYITRNTSSFSICTTNAAPGGTSFSFDWVAID